MNILLPASGQEKAAEDGGGRPQGPKELYFMRQTIGNACGTIGLLHALANVRDSVPFGNASTISIFALSLAGEVLSVIHTRFEQQAGLSFNRRNKARSMAASKVEMGISLVAHYRGRILSGEILREDTVDEPARTGAGAGVSFCRWPRHRLGSRGAGSPMPRANSSSGRFGRSTTAVLPSITNTES